MGRYIAIAVKVLPDTDQQAATVIERFGNLLAGLAMEDIPGELEVVPYTSDEEEQA